MDNRKDKEQKLPKIIITDPKLESVTVNNLEETESEQMGRNTYNDGLASKVENNV